MAYIISFQKTGKESIIVSHDTSFPFLVSNLLSGASPWQTIPQTENAPTPDWIGIFL